MEAFVEEVSRRLESEGVDFQVEVRAVSLGPGLMDVFVELATDAGLVVMCAEHSETARIVTDTWEYDVPWHELAERVHDLLLDRP
ncbi:hypothetical protein GCM10009872_37960 [Actinopolymorpha rutila]